MHAGPAGPGPQGNGAGHPPAKNLFKALWALGDWPKIARHLEGAAEALVLAAPPAPGARILEVAAGNGNVAVCAAQRGSRVTATDFCPDMVRDGVRRSRRQRLRINWVAADMEQLPFSDAQFDRVYSAFGIPFALQPMLAIEEIFRVTRGEGKVAFVNWTSDGWTSRFSSIMKKYMPPPPFPKRALDRSYGEAWGNEDNLRRLLGPRVSALEFKRGAVWSDFESVEAWFEDWKANLPPLVMARNALSPPLFQEMGKEMIESVKHVAVANGTSVRWGSEYLIAVATAKARG